MDTEEKEIIKFRFGEHNFLPPIRIAVPSNLTEEERVEFIKNKFFEISRKLEKKYIYEANFFLNKKNKLNNNKEKND